MAKLPDVLLIGGGRLASPLAIAAHPLFSFAGTLYERALYERVLYERIPFVIDQGSPPLASLIPSALAVGPQSLATEPAS
jgi:hypothetical protein